MLAGPTPDLIRDHHLGRASLARKNENWELLALILSALALIAALALGATLLSLVPLPHGFFRVFDFCRLQVAAISAAVIASILALGLVKNGAIEWAVWDLQTLALVMAVLAFVVQSAHILPFTGLWHKQTTRFLGGEADPCTLSILTSNVKQSNRDYQKVGALIERHTPDIAVFMEVDDDWVAALRPYLSDYSNCIEYPQDNSYGILFATRLETDKGSIQFLLNEHIPSVDVEVTLSNGQKARVFALHPEPPIPIRDTEARDAEILIVSELARDEERPVIVAGDLNDVAWSRTTRRFLRISRLLDPRRGRGLFNSFDARYWFLRWPLDHIFLSKHFELIEMKRLSFVGSDHFPMYYEVTLANTRQNQTPERAREDDLQESDEMIAAERRRDRPPVGEDWE
ncbi:MAG: endonuclease/exonuclease/phosphatase family protein [Rhodobacteraceae bacterium]|nr:endonuclease/exonuclease/phosphatase family protein [Paracoccaceae bacterium]